MGLLPSGQRVVTASSTEAYETDDFIRKSCFLLASPLYSGIIRPYPPNQEWDNLRWHAPARGRPACRQGSSFTVATERRP